MALPRQHKAIAKAASARADVNEVMRIQGSATEQFTVQNKVAGK